MGHVTAQEWAKQSAQDCSAFSNQQLREHIARLEEVGRDLEYKDFHDADDKMWIERNAATVDALREMLRQREACAIELCGKIDITTFTGAWANWSSFSCFDQLYWIIHGVMIGKPVAEDGAVDELLFLKELVKTKEAMHAKQ